MTLQYLPVFYRHVHVTILWHSSLQQCFIREGTAHLIGLKLQLEKTLDNSLVMIYMKLKPPYLLTGKGLPVPASLLLVHYERG